MTIEESWLRLPSESPMTVRLPLLLTGKPCSSPAATLAAPRAEHLLVGVERVRVTGGEGAAGEHVVGVRHDRDADGGQQQVGRGR